MKKVNVSFDDFKTIIDIAKSKDQMSEEAKLILWGSMIEAMAVGKITLVELNSLESLMQIDTKKYWKAFEVSTFGQEQET
jgi:hypothetical protein